MNYQIAKNKLKTKNDIIRTQVSRSLKIKMNSERPFNRELKSYFAGMTKRIIQGNKEPRTIIPLLEKQYKRVLKNYKLVNKIKDSEKKLINRLLTKIENRSRSQSQYIDTTTVNNIKDAEDRARDTLRESGIIFNEATLNKVMAKIFKNITRKRVMEISVTETQKLVEELKNETVIYTHEELEDVIIDQDEERAKELFFYTQDGTTQKVMNGIINNRDITNLFVIISLARKMWVDFGDAKVRDWHRAASGQTVRIFQFFIVMGELLKYPGDTSQGASLVNIINCRCHSVYL